MSLNQFLVMAVLSLLVTVPIVWLIPRARTSPAFDLLLWAATLVVGFLLAWVVAAMAKDAGNFSAPAVGDTPVVPVVIGALAGALAVNLPLWFADRIGAGPGEEEDEESLEEPELPVEEHASDGETSEPRPQPPN